MISTKFYFLLFLALFMIMNARHVEIIRNQARLKSFDLNFILTTTLISPSVGSVSML